MPLLHTQKPEAYKSINPLFLFFCLTPTKESKTLTKYLKVGSEVILTLFQASLEAISLATSNILIFITRLYYWECSSSLLLLSMGE